MTPEKLADRVYKKLKDAEPYWVVDDGTDRKATLEDFKYWHDNFGKTVGDTAGNKHRKGEIPIGRVDHICNHFGVVIAWRGDSA